MQWEFRKTLDSFEGYKRTVTYKNQIENGDETTLDMVVRQLELILSDKNEKILPKVLAMRFARDIMVLGQEDIVKRVEKLIPSLTKICSHDLTSADPDRGQTYFHDHPAYLKCHDEEEKKQIDTLGSTFMILSLQSVYHWAKWVPFDSTGQQSIYAKAYNSLVERGVKFPTSFHYYKQSDTEKFKNMYKMQFFTDSYESAYSEGLSSIAQSQVSEVELKQSRKSGKSGKSGWDKKSNKVSSVKELQQSQQYTGQATHLKTVNQIVEFLGEMRHNKTRKMGVLRQINKKVQDMYEVEAGLGRLPKNEKRWLQNYMINFSLFNSSMIDYDQFLKRGLSEQVVIELGVQEEDITIHKEQPKQTPMKLYQTGKQQKEGSKLKNEQSGSRLGSEINRQQQYEFKVKINALMVELEQKQNQLNILRSNSEKEKNRLIEDYESRIGVIKNEIKRGHQDRGTFQKELQKENEKLKEKVIQLEQQSRNKEQQFQNQLQQIHQSLPDKNNISYDHSRQRELQSERNHLLTKVKRLELQNQKLMQIKNNSKNYDKQLVNLETFLKEKQTIIQTTKAQLRKSEKRCQNYQDEANLYKSELLTQRAKHEQKMNSLVKTKDILESENKTLKEKILQFKKSIDVKQIETINLRQQIKRYQGKIKDLNDKKSVGQNLRADQWAKSRTGGNFLSPGKLGSSPEVEAYGTHNEKKLRFNNYEDLYNELKPSNKQLFIRLCRCGLKKKDILLKENEMQIGIITEVISDSKLKFMLHFTNTSEKQVENLKIEFNMGHSYVSTLDYQIQNKYIFCIQPQEQEKVNVIVTNREPPFLKERAILEVSFEKNGIMYNSNIFLPFLITKFYDFYKPKGIKISDKAKNPRQTVQLRFNKKMLPRNNSLKSFFEQIDEIAPNKFQVDAYHRETDLTVRILFTLAPDTQSMQIQAVTMREKINDRQRYVFEQLIGFLEIAFRK